jgi:AhpD family alkylhydroperoxidase
LSTSEPTAISKPHQVTTIPIVEEDAATGAVAEAYSDYRTRFGRQHVPGILKCFATHAPLLEQMLALASSLLFAESHLTRATKEMIVTYVSCLNACQYCLDSHASSLHHQGGSDELMLAIFQGNLESPAIGVKDIAALFACFNRVANAFGLPSQHLFNRDLGQPHIQENA